MAAADEDARGLVERKKFVPRNCDGIEIHFRRVENFASARVVEERQITAEERGVEMSVNRGRIHRAYHFVNLFLIVYRALERAAYCNGDKRGAVGAKFLRKVVHVHFARLFGGNRDSFNILNVAEFFYRIVRLFRNVEHGRNVACSRKGLPAEVDAVHIAVGAAVGNNAPVVVAEAVGAGEKVYAVRLEIVGIEHVPIGLVRVADVYQRDVAEFCFGKPSVKFGKPRILIEGIAELVELVRHDVRCGSVELRAGVGGGKSVVLHIEKFFKFRK